MGFASLIINTLLITAVVVIHYKILRLLSSLIPKLEIKHRLRVVIGVFGTICAHIVEVWLFGLAFFLMLKHGGLAIWKATLMAALSIVCTSPSRITPHWDMGTSSPWATFVSLPELKPSPGCR